MVLLLSTGTEEAGVIGGGAVWIHGRWLRQPMAGLLPCRGKGTMWLNGNKLEREGVVEAEVGMRQGAAKCGTGRRRDLLRRNSSLRREGCSQVQPAYGGC